MVRRIRIGIRVDEFMFERVAIDVYMIILLCTVAIHVGGHWVGQGRGPQHHRGSGARNVHVMELYLPYLHLCQ